MAAPALAVQLTIREKSSKGGTSLMQGSLAGRSMSANGGHGTSSASEHHSGTQDRVSRQYREDSSESSSNISTPSWEDYDALKAEPGANVRTLRDGTVGGSPTLITSEMHISSSDQGGNGGTHQGLESPASGTEVSQAKRLKNISIKLDKPDEKGRYLLTGDDPELREILRRGIERQSQGADARKRSRFSDLIFTRQLTAFDRQNPMSASSPFHGFYTLFWLGTALLLLRVGANNWRTYGSVFGRNEIMTMMFHRDVAVLGLTDGIMCACTLFCLVLQKAIIMGYLSWNKQGWIIQNVSISRKLSQE